MLPPPWTEAGSAVLPDQIEPHLLVRNVDPVRVDIGPVAWEELRDTVGCVPREGEVNSTRNWLQDSLPGASRPCFVPLDRSSLSPALRVAALLSHVVRRVVLVVEDASVLVEADAGQRALMGSMEGILIGGKYLPFAGRIPVLPGHIAGGELSSASVLIAAGDGMELGWDKLRELAQGLRGAGKKWSAPVPAEAPPDGECLRELSKGGCEEIRVCLRSMSPRTRTAIGETSEVEDLSRLFREAHRQGLKNAVSLEVGFPGESRDVFLGNLGSLRTVSYFLDSVFDLHAFSSQEGTRTNHDWHDRGANTLSWRRKKGRELASFIIGEGLSSPWFFMPIDSEQVESNEAIYNRLLNSL